MKEQREEVKKLRNFGGSVDARSPTHDWVHTVQRHKGSLDPRRRRKQQTRGRVGATKKTTRRFFFHSGPSSSFRSTWRTWTRPTRNRRRASCRSSHRSRRYRTPRRRKGSNACTRPTGTAFARTTCGGLDGRIAGLGSRRESSDMAVDNAMSRRIVKSRIKSREKCAGVCVKRADEDCRGSGREGQREHPTNTVSLSSSRVYWRVREDTNEQA